MYFRTSIDCVGLNVQRVNVEWRLMHTKCVLSLARVSNIWIFRFDMFLFVDY